MSHILVKRIKGTNDIFNDELKYWYHIERIFREIARRYNYSEMRTPIFEATELFIRGVGEETDVVQKQMYTFEDRGGRSITLRPEGTAPVIRAFLENDLSTGGLPKKFYYMGPIFRYEKPQAGRMRQFHQYGVELIGSSDPVADFETIKFAIDFLNAVGLRDYELRIGSIGCGKCRKEYKSALKKYYSDKYDQLCEDCKRRFNTNILRLLDCKIDVELAKSAPETTDYLCDECAEHFKKLRIYLDSLGINYVVDGHLVRGLDYYTRTVFEIKHSSLGAQDTLIGGGRYDGLVEELGGRPTPSVGFAGGFERLILVLKQENIKIKDLPRCQVYIATVGEKARMYGLKLAENLRLKDISVDMDLMGRNLRNQLKHANRINARYSIILGDEELAREIAIFRDMDSGEQTEVDLDWMENYIAEKIKEGD